MQYMVLALPSATLCFYFFQLLHLLFQTDTLPFLLKYQKAREGSSHKRNAQKELLEVISHRLHVDNSIEFIGKLLFSSKQGSEVLKTVRPAGQPLVDDWSCLKSMVSILINMIFNNFKIVFC